MAPAARFYGMQIPEVQNGFWPNFEVGAVRLWDNNLCWYDVNPSPHVFDWTKLDRAVDLARSNGARVLLVLGQTPLWCSSTPFEPSAMGRGHGAYPTDHAYWVEYVQQVATRYKGRIDEYEIWNEPDIEYGTMTPEQVAYLSSLAVRTIRPIDPAAYISSPSFVTRIGSTFAKAFIAAGGAKGAGWALDTWNVHGYPPTDQRPEFGINAVMAYKDTLDAAAGLDLPIWCTEINVGVRVPTAYPIGLTLQAAYAARSWLFGVGRGVRRVYWYGWQNTPHLGVKIVDPYTNANPGDPGVAMDVARDWMRGTVAYSFDSARGMNELRVDYPAGHPWDATPATIRWTGDGDVVYPDVPVGATKKYNMFGTEIALNKTVNGLPVLYR